MSDRPVRLIRFRELVPYSEAHSLQLRTVEARKAGEVPDTLILLEHEPVITLGKNADGGGVVAPENLLSQRGISVHRVERGGQATYHGPGQITGYPVMDLHSIRSGVARYVRNLEEVMIRAATVLGVPAARRDGITGVFAKVNGAKVGAIGVRVSRGITFHGFAFNVTTRLSDYDLIIPCGMADTPVSSIGALIGDAADEAELMERAYSALQSAFEDVFGVRVETSGEDSADSQPTG